MKILIRKVDYTFNKNIINMTMTVARTAQNDYLLSYEFDPQRALQNLIVELNYFLK